MIADVVTFLFAVVGMVLCLVGGYWLGYMDAQRKYDTSSNT